MTLFLKYHAWHTSHKLTLPHFKNSHKNIHQLAFTYYFGCGTPYFVDHSKHLDHNLDCI